MRMILMLLLALSVTHAEAAVSAVYEPWYVKYFWQILAIGIAPVFGFALAQKVKRALRRKPSGFVIAQIAGIATALFATAAWWKASRDVEGAILIGVLIGVLQPIVIWIWFQVAKRFAPESYENLKCGDNHKPFLPWER